MVNEDVDKKLPRTKALGNCPVCESRDTRLFFLAPDRLHGTPGEFSYHLCGKCGTVFQNPMIIQEDLHLCYPSEYMPYNYDPEMPKVSFEAGDLRGQGADPRRLIRQAVINQVWGEPLSGVAGVTGKIFARSRIARERAFYGIVPDECLPSKRGLYFALDVGCGAGWMLKRLKKVGWLAEGIEWDERTAHLAAERTGARVYAGDFKEIALPKEKYSLIFLSHVFEHFNDPMGALKRFYELLAKKGKLVLIYPNPESVDSKWFGKDWFAWEVPRHLILPSPRAVKQLAERAGFIPYNIYTRTAKHLWVSSKAYQIGLHPERDKPALNFSEKAGLLYQTVMEKAGANCGSEIVAVLEKP